MNSENFNNSENTFYIVYDRFKEAKNRLKGKRIDCKNETLASVTSVTLRQFQKYIKKTNPSPIPEDRLHALCEYMNVIPEYLTGKKDRFATLRGLGNERMQDEFEKYRCEQKLVKYIESIGIQSYFDNGELYMETDLDGRPYLDTTTGGNDNPYFKYKEVEGVILTYNEYHAYLKSLRETIESFSKLFIRNVVSARTGFEEYL